MTRNRSRRHSPRLGIEVFESRCLLSVAGAGADALADDAIRPVVAKSAAAPSSPSPTLTSQDAIIGASVARARYDVSGAGLTAAVIDTGVDYDHPAFGGNFRNGGVVVAGYDFGEGDADPKSNESHGTAVAGIIASRDPRAPGVAPGADIAALRVFGDSGKGSFEGIADALQWVVSHHKTHKISVVNLSISDGNNYAAAPTLFAGPVVRRIIGLIDTLEGLNIPVVTAAGNNFSGQQGMGFTAIVDNTISVTGSDADDRIAPDAQRLGKAVGGKSATDLAAPGRDVMGPWTGTSVAPLNGTSFAAPLVTGSVLLLQELYLKRFGTLPSVSQVEGWLRDSAVPTRDPVTGITIGRLDVPAAAAKVPAPVVATPPPSSSGSGGAAKGPSGGSNGSTTAPPASKPTTPPAGQGGSAQRPATPPQAGAGGSGSGSGSSKGGSKPTTTPPSALGGGNSGSTGNGSKSSSGSGSAASPTPPQVAPPPATPPQAAPPPAEAPTAPERIEPVAPPSSPAEPTAPVDITVPAPPEEAPPAPTVVPIGTPAEVDAALGAITTDPIGDDGGEAPADPVAIEPTVDPEVIPPVVEVLDGVDRPAGEPPTGPIAEESETEPRGDAAPIGDAAQQLAALFHPTAPAIGVRAWHVNRPNAPAILSRALILRSSRAATAAQQARPPRPVVASQAFPAASNRPFAALRPMR